MCIQTWLNKDKINKGEHRSKNQPPQVGVVDDPY